MRIMLKLESMVTNYFSAVKIYKQNINIRLRAKIIEF